jgi:hypothetical protein
MFNRRPQEYGQELHASMKSMMKKLCLILTKKLNPLNNETTTSDDLYAAA